MKSVKELQELREEIVPRLEELRKIDDSDEKWTPEVQENWDKVNTDYDALTAKIERAQRAEEIEANRINVGELRKKEDHENRLTGKPTSEDRGLAFNGWARSGVKKCKVTDEQADAMQRCGLAQGQNEIFLNMADTRAFNKLRGEQRQTPFESTATGWGGEFIAEGFVPRLESALLAFGGMFNTSEVLRTETGAALPWPTDNDTGNTGELIGETFDSADSATTTQSIPTSSTTFNAFKYSSKIIRVTNELMQDAFLDIGAFVGDKAGERIGRITNTHLTTGTGSAQPNGIVTAATAGPTSSAAAAIDEDDIIDLQHSVDPAYRNQPGAGFMFHDSILKAIRKIKDTDGQFLWSNGLIGGIAPTLAGFPYQINQDMASTVQAGAKTMLFGALRKYKIRQVREMRLLRLVERYAEFDQVGFIAFLRLDGDLLDAGTNPIKYLLQAGGGS